MIAVRDMGPSQCSALNDHSNPGDTDNRLKRCDCKASFTAIGKHPSGRPRSIDPALHDVTSMLEDYIKSVLSQFGCGGPPLKGGRPAFDPGAKRRASEANPPAGPARLGERKSARAKPIRPADDRWRSPQGGAASGDEESPEFMDSSANEAKFRCGSKDFG
jgi:hypothetical protein